MQNQWQNPYYGFGYPSRPMQTYFPQAPQQPAAAQTVNASMVTSRAEAEAAQILFDNSLNLYVNLAQGEIYAKRFNPQTGGADFAVFSMPRPQPQEPSPAFAPMDMVQTLMQRMEACEAQLNAFSNKKSATDKKEDEA